MSYFKIAGYEIIDGNVPANSGPHPIPDDVEPWNESYLVGIQSSKWDYRFLQAAELFASWSKDPSNQVGAVVVRPDKTIASTGFNGFPRNTDDSQELYENRDEKLRRVKHAEE